MQSGYFVKFVSSFALIFFPQVSPKDSPAKVENDRAAYSATETAVFSVSIVVPGVKEPASV